MRADIGLAGTGWALDCDVAVVAIEQCFGDVIYWVFRFRKLV